MSVPAPHFLLVSQAVACRDADDESSGRWRFALQTPDGRPCLEAEDDEPETSPERLELLAIVRGLEALDEPARVTVVAAGRSISRGLRYGVAQWRENDWQWERYGQLVPVKNGDLWQRIDRAMAIHQIECRDASPACDDLAIPRRSASEGESDLPDVRIIRHRGRRLRIDRPMPTVERRRSKVERRPKSSRFANVIGHWGLVIGIFAAIRRVFAAR